MGKFFIGVYNWPNLITLAALGLSFAAMVFIDNRPIAMLCLFHAAVLDGFDGALARKLNTNRIERKFGGQLDSLVDAVAYGAVPVLFALNSGCSSRYDTIALFFYLGAICIRLAHFNCEGMKVVDERRYFTGMPSTYVAGILPAVVGLAEIFSISIVWTLRITFSVLPFLLLARLRVADIRGYKYGQFLTYLCVTLYWAWRCGA